MYIKHNSGICSNNSKQQAHIQQHTHTSLWNDPRKAGLKHHLHKSLRKQA